MTKYAKCSVCGYVIAIYDDTDASDYVCPVDGTTLVVATRTEYMVTEKSAATFIVAASDSLHKERADYVCPGVDDQVVIQAAIDAMSSSGGKILLLEGTYNFGARININTDNIILEGYTAIIFQQTGSANNGIIETRASNVKILGLTINGNKAGNPVEIHAIGLYAFGGDIHSNIMVKDCYIYNSDGDGVEIGYGDISNVSIIDNVMHDNREHDVHVNGGNKILIANNICYNNESDSIILTSGNAPIGYVTIENNIVHNTNGCGIGVGAQYVTVGPNYRPIGTIVQGNILYSNVEGININKADDTIVINNLIKLNTHEGIKIEDENVGVSIIGNTISENTADMAGNQPAIDLVSDGVIIDGNRICNNHKIGIYIRGTDKHQITNNYICNNSQNTSNTWAAITAWISDVTGDSSHNVIRGNTIFSDGANVQKYGISFTGGGSALYKNWVIEDNKIWGSGTAEIELNHIDSSTKYFDSSIDLFMDVLAVSATHVRLDEDLSEAIPNTFTITAQPDVPRTLSGHFDTHAQITAYTIVITGTDAKGNTVTETFTEAASPWDFETVNAYATITSIIMTTRTGTGAGDTMDIGITDVLGLSNIIYEASDVFKIKKNNANAAVAAAQVNTTYDTYDMAVIGLAATDDFTIWYKSNLNIIS